MNTNLPNTYQSRSGITITFTELDSGTYQASGQIAALSLDLFCGTKTEMSDFLAVVEMLDHTDQSDVMVSRIQDRLLRLLRSLNDRSQE